MKKQKKYYLIYQITNNLNHKIYIGKHETDNLDDDYFGSGKHLKNAQNKYGLENFIKTILFYCSNREEMNLLEQYVVTPEFCQREDVYNINEGGNGGWYISNYNGNNGSKQFFKNKSDSEKSEIGRKGGIATNQKIQLLSLDKQKEYFKNSRLKYLKWLDKNPNYFKGENNPMFNHVYTQQTISKMSNSHLGKKNHMSNKMWICNDYTKESKTILKTDLIPIGWRKGRICKK